MIRSSSVPLVALAALGCLVCRPAQSSAQSDISITAGSVFEKGMESMPSTPALTQVRLGYSVPAAGLALEYNRGNYPWPPPNENSPFCRGGLASLALSAETYPLHFLDRALTGEPGNSSISMVSRVLRPFVGVGVLHANENVPGDGHAHRTADGQHIHTSAQTALLLTYGTSVLIPTMVRNVRVDLQYRRGHRLAGEMGGHNIDGSPGLQPARQWGQWNVGFSLIVN